MTARLLLNAAVTAALLLFALSTGGRAFLLLALLLAAVTLYALISVLTAARGLSVSVTADHDRVRRGEDVILTLAVRGGGVLPVAPVRVQLRGGDSDGLTFRGGRGREQRLELTLHASHVGPMDPGIEQVLVEDLFGFFQLRRRPENAVCPLLVLPREETAEQLAYAPGDSGFETLARATEDISNPADVRSYQPGDALKKIHWKLSLRKGELMVRRFEEPVLAEALVLPDCSPPPGWGDPEAAATVRDALLETCLSVAAHEMRDGHSVRMPLLGAHPWTFESSVGLSPLEENLARLDFSETDRFERVLMLEARRLRKVGATAVVAARLNSAMVDMMIRMLRMGPFVRFYLITFTPDDPRIGPLVSKLRQGNVEVRLITPREM